MATTVDATTWFQTTLGLPEASWLTLPRDVTVVPMAPPQTLLRCAPARDLGFPCLGLRNCVTGDVHAAGAFKAVTIAELDALCAVQHPDATPAVFEIRARRRMDALPALFEVSHIQADPELRGRRVMIQVASNFNCLEVSSARVDPAAGTYATKLMSDSTQGPAASSGAAVSATVRAHAAFYAPDTDPSQWGQSLAAGRLLNLLDDPALTPLFPVVNGKVFAAAPQDTTTVLNVADETLLGRVKVGLHCGVPVSFKRVPRKLGLCTPIPEASRNVVNQVFVSTANLREKHVKRLAPRVEWSRTRFLLAAAFLGTYAAAAACQDELLVLTLVGGGVFLNPISDVAWAIARAHKAWGARSGLRRVILPIYLHDDEDTVEELVGALAAQGIEPVVTWY